MLELANAGAYRQNCSFHCLTHVWLDYLKHNFSNLDMIIAEHPIYHAILAEVNEYYQLKGQSFKKFDELIQFDDQFPNPIDREIFWGSILRNVLRDFVLKENEKHKAKDDNDMDDVVQVRLANALGAGVRYYVHIDDKPFQMDYFQAQKQDFDVHIFHTQKGGGHFDFSFYNGDKQDIVKNAEHNKQLKWQQNEFVKRYVPNSKSWFSDVYDINGVENQKAFIRERVQSNLKILMSHKQDQMIQRPHKPLPKPPGILVHKAQKKKHPALSVEKEEKSVDIQSTYKKPFASLRAKCKELELSQACEQMLTRHLEFLITTLLELKLEDQESLNAFIADASIGLENKMTTQVSETIAELMAKQEAQATSKQPKKGFFKGFKRQELQINPVEKTIALEMAIADLTKSSEPNNASVELKRPHKSKF